MRPQFQAGKRQHFALGRLKPGEMNKMEASYEADVLKPALIAGKLLWYKFEGIKLRLADNTFYTPDFFVMGGDGHLQCHEIKGGFWQDDARAKIKIAAAMFPFHFIAVTRKRKGDGGGWAIEEF